MPYKNPEDRKRACKRHYSKPENMAKQVERTRKWREKNKEKYVLNNQRYGVENREKRSAYQSKWGKANRHKTRASWQRRKARKLENGGSHTGDEIMALGQRQEWRCANPFCKVDITGVYHIDHITALSRGGSNGIENIQLLCPPCNRTKWAKSSEEWLRQQAIARGG